MVRFLGIQIHFKEIVGGTLVALIRVAGERGCGLNGLPHTPQGGQVRPLGFGLTPAVYSSVAKHRLPREAVFSTLGKWDARVA